MITAPFKKQKIIYEKPPEHWQNGAIHSIFSSRDDPDSYIINQYGHRQGDDEYSFIQAVIDDRSQRTQRGLYVDHPFVSGQSLDGIITPLCALQIAALVRKHQDRAFEEGKKAAFAHLREVIGVK